MKNLTGGRAFAVVSFLMMSVLSLWAHPGHELGAYGTKHVMTSPYHLGVLAVSGLILFWAARFIQYRVSRRCAQMAGLVAVVTAGVLWAA